MPAKIPGLIRINLTIQEELRDMALRRAKQLKLKDGLSGLVARVLKVELKNKRKRTGAVGRLFSPSRHDR